MQTQTTPENQAEFQITNLMVFNIAWPMTIAYVTTPLLGVVDTAVVGRLGDAALLGGLAIGAILFDVIFTTFNFLRASTTGLVAQSLGANDQYGQHAVLWRGLVIAAIAGLILVIFSGPLLTLGIDLMGASGRVAEATTDYFQIRILAAPLTLSNYVILGWLLGLGRAGLGLMVQTVLNGVNIVFSILLGLGLGWGIQGVAIATLIGEAAGLIIGGVIVWRLFDRNYWPGRAAIFDRSKLVRLFAINRDIMIRSGCLIFAFAFFTAQGSRFGEITLAANAVLMNFFIVSGYFLDGMATAAEQLSGRAIGARYRPAFDRAVALSIKWGALLAFLLTAAIWVSGDLLIDMMTTNDAVRSTAKQYLIWAAATAIAGVLAFQMDGVFMGATWSQDLRNMMLISVVVYLLIWWFAVPVWGNHGLWLALEVFLGIRGISLLWRMTVRRKLEFA